MRVIGLGELAGATGLAFGTSGVRGPVSQMSAEACAAYTAAFLGLPGLAAPRVAVGMDLRPSSPLIARAVMMAVRLAGREAEFCGALPTPALAFYAMQEGIPAVMVTGSHIPFDRNGIKFYRPDGEISKTDESAILGATVRLPDDLALPRLPAIEALAQERYLERYLRFFPAGALAGLRLGFYQHSSVARDLLTELLSRLGAEVAPLDRTDEFVPIDTEAVSERDGERARLWCREFGFDALISTDGDADRPLIGDEAGNWLRGDAVGLLCALHLGVRGLAAPVSCNTAIERCGSFAEVLRTRIGSPYVIEGMQALIARGVSPAAGFEANGGFLLGSPVEKAGVRMDPLPTRDAVLPILTLLAVARERGVPLSSLAAGLPSRFTASDRIQAFAPERSRGLIGRLRADPQPLVRLCGPVVREDVTDGLRLTFAGDDIVHLRPSGNAPELRCYAEAGSPQRAAELVREALELCLNL